MACMARVSHARSLPKSLWRAPVPSMMEEPAAGSRNVSLTVLAPSEAVVFKLQKLHSPLPLPGLCVIKSPVQLSLDPGVMLFYVL